LSFEIARYFRRHNIQQPAHLFISGRGAPHIPSDEPPMHDLPESEFVGELRRGWYAAWRSERSELYIKDGPVWDAISGDSRFGELLRRMGIQR
jgi:hypothetical protein